jgi:flagellar hook-length control protein FliK
MCDIPGATNNQIKGGERMRTTDATLFGLSGSRDKTPSSRMDRMQNQSRNDSDMGFGNEKKSKSRFKETYTEIARSNDIARQTTDSSTRNKSCQRKTTSDRDTLDQAYEDRLMSDAATDKVRKKQNTPIQETSSNSEATNRVDNDSDSDSDSEDEDDLTQNQQASEIIKQSLIDVAEIMQLNIVPGLEQVSFEEANDETVSQIAQIVHDMKNIMDGFDAAVTQEQSIDTGKTVIECKDAADLVAKLKTELFKIEIGVNMLGKSEEVQNQLALKMDSPVSSGILQATDPSQISMSMDQVKKIFSEALNPSEDSSNVSQLVKKLNELVQDNPVEKQQVSIMSVSVEKSQAEVTSFDSQMYRAMLKIEAKEKVSQENVDAASKSESVLLPDSANGTLARDVSVQDTKLSEQMLAVTEITGKANQSQNNILTEIRTPVNLTKTMEQSIIDQLATKIHTAVRSGVTEVRVQLRPEALGDVTLKIRIEGDVVTAHMQVESQQVKAIVENNFQSLKDSLAQHNLQAGSFEVNVQTGEKQADSSGEGFFKNESSGQNSASSDNDSRESGVALDDGESQSETGRRFGNNTVEYFA